jgi:hypothetical protein
VGELLEQLVERVLDQPTLNNPGDLERLLRELAAAPPASAADGGPAVVSAVRPPGTRPTSS